jgi:TolB-like protein/Flp pilus assembly protein TadD
LDVISICLAVVALSFFVARFFWFDVQNPDHEATRVALEDNDEPLRTRYPPNSIAVLPFVNMSDDPANEYFSDGVSEELLNLLARIHELKVISRSSTFSFKDKDVDIPTIAEQLNVAYVLEGSVRKADERVRVTVQLIDAYSDTHVWSDTYDRNLDDIFAIQDDIARTVVERLKITLLGQTPRSEETDPEAYMLYLQARHLGNRGTGEGTEQSIALYKEALAVVPGYAAAWSGLANGYLNLYLHGQMTREESIRQARDASEKALQLDKNHAPAYAHLSRIELTYDRDLRLAASHLQHALTLEPTNPEILHRAIVMAYRLGRMDEAIRIGRFTIGRDPGNPESHYYLGIAYLWAGRLDDSIESFRTTQMLSPEYTSVHYRTGVALLLKGKPESALAEMQLEQHRAKQLEGLTIANFALGKLDQSSAALEELIEKYEFNSAYNIAYVLAYCGENDRAFEWLGRAAQFNDSGFTQLAYQPEFTNIHDDPRWAPYLESVGMSPTQLGAIDFSAVLPQ